VLALALLPVAEALAALAAGGSPSVEAPLEGLPLYAPADAAEAHDAEGLLKKFDA
jgi:hypothetical protein